MTFSLSVKFAGILGFVRNVEPKAYPPMCAIAVDGVRPRRALDGMPLCRHRAFLKFPINNIRGGEAGIAESFGLWYLDGRRVYFDVEEECNPQGLTIKEMPLMGRPHPEEPDPSDPENFRSLTWMFSMKRIFPGFKIDSRLLEAMPPREVSVGAQIVIDRGVLSTDALTTVVWECDRTLSTPVYRQVFSHRVELRINKLRSARIVSIGLSNPDDIRVLDLTEISRSFEGELTIEVLNLCDQNPLQWGLAGRPLPDEDVKWYFELLDPNLKEDVRRRLGAAELPIPRPIRDYHDPRGGIGAPGSGNCLKTDLGKAQFQLPVYENS